MIQPETLAAMLADRTEPDSDPTLPAVEAVLLRAAIERVDDFLTWLDEHTASTHGGDPSTAAVCQILNGVRIKLAREVALVDLALQRIEE